MINTINVAENLNLIEKHVGTKPRSEELRLYIQSSPVPTKPLLSLPVIR